MRTTFAPYTWVFRIFAASRSAGMKIHALKPLRAACAATEFARFPVEEHDTVSNPNARACDSATDTTRSLKLSVGRHTASFFTNNLRVPSAFASLGAVRSGVKPTGNVGWKSWGRGRSSE